jgi:hypothetical protein
VTLTKAEQLEFRRIKANHGEAARMRFGHGRGDNHCLKCWKDEEQLIELVEKLLKKEIS